MPDDESQQPPEHLLLMSWSAKGYKSYVDSLKFGAQSGVSRQFGLASDILPLNLQDVSSEKSPAAAFQQPPDEQMPGRTLYLALRMRLWCTNFLDTYLAFARDGQFGKEMSQCLTESISADVLTEVRKELTCISLYLLLFDLGNSTLIPAWLRECLGGSLGASDFLIPKPTAANVLKTHESVLERYSVTCKRVAWRMCVALGLSSALRYAQPPLDEFLLNSVSERRKLLGTALEAPFEQIEAELHASLS